MMESINDSLVISTDIKNETQSHVNDVTQNSPLSRSILDNVTVAQLPVKQSKYNTTTRNEIYNIMCPWDYLVSFSNVSVNGKQQSTHSTCSRQMESLINNFELLISQFKILINKSCLPKNDRLEGEADDTIAQNLEKIPLTENLSKILGYQKPSDDILLTIKDPYKITGEYVRSSKVLDLVIETISYKDLGDSESPTDAFIQVENATIDINHCNFNGEVPGDKKENKLNVKSNERKPPYSNEPTSRFKSKKSSQKKMIVSNSLGYKSEFGIEEQVYDEIINKGSPYTCPPCKRIFKDRRNFEHHVDGRCVGVPEKGMEWEPKWKKEDGRLHCLYSGCSETYTHKQSLYKHHQRAHLKDVDDLPYKCDQCDKSFIIKSILSIHVQETHKEKIRKCCEICGASVRSNTDLKLHMRRRHTGEMPFKCEYCDFRGVNISSVKRHTRLKHETHLLTFHCCDICGKQFKTKANLKEHIPTHSDKRTFLCKICGKCLKNDCSYRRHMVCVHGIKFTCELCGKDYSAMIGLKVHQRNVHGINS